MVTHVKALVCEHRALHSLLLFPLAVPPCLQKWCDEAGLPSDGKVVDVATRYMIHLLQDMQEKVDNNISVRVSCVCMGELEDTSATAASQHVLLVMCFSYFAVCPCMQSKSTLKGYHSALQQLYAGVDLLMDPHYGRAHKNVLKYLEGLQK